MGVLLIMRLSSKFTFDYKYIINGFQHNNESCAHMLAARATLYTIIRCVVKF